MSYLERIENFNNGIRKEIKQELDKLTITEFKIKGGYIYHENYGKYKVNSILKVHDMWCVDFFYHVPIYFHELSIENQAEIIDLIKS